MSGSRTTVVIADDHPLVLRGLSELIRSEPDMDILASCTDGISALEHIRRLEPDIAIIDRSMPGLNGLEILQAVKAGGLPTRIVLLTADVSDADMVGAVAGGIEGILMKSAAPDMLVSCLREVAAGRHWLPSDTVAAAIDREAQRRDRAREIFKPLTDREREITSLASRGLSNKEIARTLDIAEGTVKIHLNNVYSKLGVGNRAALLAAVGGYLDLLLQRS